MNTGTMVIDRDLVERVKTEIDITALIGETLAVTGRGRILTTAEHDSLKIYTKTNSFTWWSQDGKSGKVAGGSTIDWMMKRLNCDRDAAIEALAAKLGVIAAPGANARHRSPEAPNRPVIRDAGEVIHEWKSREWQRENVQSVERAREAIFGTDERGLEYEETVRKIEPATLIAFRIGYAIHWNADVKRNEPAIIFPWYTFDGKTLRGVRVRFLKQYQIGLKPDGTPKMSQKTTSVSGKGQFTGAFYGTQALTRFDDAPCGRDSYGPTPDYYVGAERLRTLFMNEGETNTLSIWQESQDTGVDVLGFGTEQPSITQPMVDFAKRFGTLITWMDKPERAQAVERAFGCKNAIESKDDKDANKCLQLGELGGLLSAYRFNKAQTPQERERLLWNLADKARGWYGVDVGTKEVIERIAKMLGKTVQLSEVRPGTWRAV